MNHYEVIMPNYVKFAYTLWGTYYPQFLIVYKQNNPKSLKGDHLKSAMTTVSHHNTLKTDFMEVDFFPKMLQV